MCFSHQFSLSGFEEQQFAFVRKAGLVCMCLKEQQFCSGQQLSLYVFGRFQAYYYVYVWRTAVFSVFVHEEQSSYVCGEGVWI